MAAAQTLKSNDQCQRGYPQQLEYRVKVSSLFSLYFAWKSVYLNLKHVQSYMEMGYIRQKQSLCNYNELENQYLV